MIFLKHILIVFFQFALVTSLVGQKKEIKAALKKAQPLMETEDYLNALRVYKTVLNMDRKNEKAGVNAALCMFRLNYPVDSMTWLVSNLSSSSLPDAKFYYAKILHQQREFDQAIALLEDYNKKVLNKRAYNNDETEYMIEVCRNAKKMMASPHRSIVKNIGPEINSAFPDYVPVILPDESALYFTSRREGSSNNVKDAYNRYHEDIYVSHKQNGKWQKAENINGPVNSDVNDACVAISPDGQRMIVFRTTANLVSGDLYITKIGADNKWEPLQILGREINSQFIETSACFSNDTSEIYFTSNRPGGYGGKDIYRIKKLPNGQWGLPYNLGPTINTIYDEDAPFLHPDGVTLYFSSKGHNTMGEYDVFKSILNRETNQFSKTENLGYPINNVGNDIFFVLSVDGQRGYYSSVKDDSYGGNDIYIIDTRFGDNDLTVKGGTAFLGDSPNRVKITLFDSEDNTVSGIYSSNPKTGKFIIVVNPLKSYKATVEQEGYKTLIVNLEPLALDSANKNLEFKLQKKN